MKGTLHKTDQGWMISRRTFVISSVTIDNGATEVWEEQIPLHPDDVKQINADAQVFDNIDARIAAYPDVEFNIVNEYAKLLTNKTK